MCNFQIIVIRLFSFLVIYGLSVGLVVAQKPEIKSIDKLAGSMNEVVTLSGSFFGTDATRLAVTFGASRGTIQSISDQLLEVRVPAGATYYDIGVTNLLTGFTGYSRQQFLLDFGGAPGFDLANLQGQFDFPSGIATADGLYDLCMCDFDGDKRVEVATANDNSGFINLYPNNSSPTMVSFPGKIAVNIASRSLHIKCGDLNGDGKPDLVATESGTTDKVFVLKNNSAGVGNFAFSAPQVISLAGKRPKRIEIADLDLDGKPELIITAQGANTVTVLVNQSSLASISFSNTPLNITIPGAVSTEGIAVEDLNGDGRPEIITSQFQTNSDIYIVENKSVPGAYATGAISSLSVGTAIKNIRVGDLDGDRKPDIAYTKLTSAEVGLFRNQSTASALSFSAGPSIATDITPWGIDLGDLDGDGKADIVVASITRKTITILNNKSTAGSLAFDRLIQPTTYINRHLNICDVDTDGKPDIVFTSIDDNNLNIAASKVSVFRNATCMIPEVTPPGPLNVCTGLGLKLIATSGGGVTYAWTNATAGTTIAGTNEYSPTVFGDYFVTATSEAGSCKEVSNTVRVNLSAGAAADPAPVNNGPVCLGETLNLSISNDLGAGYTYAWTGPDNYTGTGLNPAQIPNFQLKNAGRYHVNVIASSGCVARTESTLVEAVDLPEFKVSFSGSAFICQPDFKSLSVFPAVPGFTYQWYEKTLGVIAGATSASLLRNTTGEYYYEATSSNPGCPVATSESAVITVVAPPTVAFTLPASACRGQEVSFTNQSTFDSQATPTYAWNFGDGNASTDKDPKHIYATAGSFSVSLQVSYIGNACPVSLTKPITITTAPAVTITNDQNKFEICSSGSLVLGVSDTFTSYLWSTGATTPTITVVQPGQYAVNVLAANGCDLKAEQEIISLPAPNVVVTATPEVIVEGESSLLSASGLLNYMWQPGESLSNTDVADPVATPLATTSYTVTGTAANGCEGSANVVVQVKGESIVSKLSPSNFFSPNGDAVGQYWIIEQIDLYPQCEVTIYDDKGVKVYGAKPYQNDWEGTYNTNSGKRLPDGVYYYIIRCDGEENEPRTGSITLLR
jgi:gliding motility-associated-like protein